MTDITETAAPAANKKAEPVITTVVMKDGRTVDFSGKRTMQKTDVVVDGMPAVQFDFINGESRTFRIDLGGLHEKFAQHGLKQKLGDEVAGYKDIDDAVMAIDELADRLAKGEFNAVREANGMAGASILVKALVEAYSKDAATIKTWLSGKTQAQKKALRNDARIAPIVKRLEDEKAAKETGKDKIDTESLLSELA